MWPQPGTKYDCIDGSAAMPCNLGIPSLLRNSLALEQAILTPYFPLSSLLCQGKGQRDTRAPFWSILKLSLTAARLPGQSLLVPARPRCDEH